MPNPIQYSATNLTGSLRKGDVALGVTTASIVGPTSTTGWYSGITPQSGKYTIYDVYGSDIPLIYAPQNSDELKRLALSYGATSGNVTSEAAILSWFGTQNGLLAANFEYENIVTNGLVLNLDAGFVGSYPTTGNNWYDLSGNGNNGTLTNGPTYSSANGGSIIFDGTDDYIGGPTLATNSPLSFTNGNFTLEHWIKITAYEPSAYFGLTNMILSKGPASTYNYATQVTNSTTLSFIHRNNSEDLIFLNFTVPTITNNITQIVFSITLTQVSLYLNGTLIETKSLTGNPITPYSNDVLLIGGFYNTSNTNFIGNMYLHRIYNRALTATEISQNYNATKARFGL